MNASARLFVAVRLGNEVNAAIASVAEGLREKARRFGMRCSWASVEGWHLTLKFLGQTEPERVEPLATAIEAAAAGLGPCELEARGIGFMPGHGRPRIIHAQADGSGLARLASEVEAAAVACGFEPERRNFHGHMTIARVRRPGRWREFKEELGPTRTMHFGTSRISELAIYESRLGRGPARYDRIRAFELAG